MVIIQAIAHRDTLDLAQQLNHQRMPPSRTFIPDLIQGAQALPYTPWPNFSKPPPQGWWADRQDCTCPPCYFNTLTSSIANNTLPFSVAVPLAQLINVGLLRLNFRHAHHNNIITVEDREYALSLQRDICYGINSGQLPLQLLEILLVASRKAVLKPLDAERPEYQHKEFEMCLKRAIAKCKQEGSGEESCVDDEEQTHGGAQQDDDEESGSSSSDENEHEQTHNGQSDKETQISPFTILPLRLLTYLQPYLMDRFHRQAFPCLKRPGKFVHPGHHLLIQVN
ncbi:hypothetical protein E4T44_03661 [Aureobasidium sp. EXF-8845]|nr:hypothetical protein E4T44_03661 [Aureobasidium sp. EXF-8845]KAI4854937.1 hypothetical protein E4T45_03632 [Aureobasidium sp. EXF-8846]